MRARTVKRLAACLVLGLGSSLAAAWGFKFIYIVVGSAPTAFTCVDDTGEWHVSHWRALGRRSYTLSATGWLNLSRGSIPVPTTALVVTPDSDIPLILLRDDLLNSASLAGPLGPEVPGNADNWQQFDTVTAESPTSDTGDSPPSVASPMKVRKLAAAAAQLQVLSGVSPSTRVLTVPPSRHTGSGSLPDWVRRPNAGSEVSQLATGAYGWPLPCLKGELEIYPSASGRFREVYPCSLMISQNWAPTGMKFAMPLKVLWRGLAVDWAAHAGLWAMPLVVLPAARSARRRARGRCPECGYELAGNLRDGCPECGWERLE